MTTTSQPRGVRLTPGEQIPGSVTADTPHFEPCGLTAGEVEQRQKQYGSNLLLQRPAIWRRLLAQIVHFFAVMSVASSNRLSTFQASQFGLGPPSDWAGAYGRESMTKCHSDDRGSGWTTTRSQVVRTGERQQHPPTRESPYCGRRPDAVFVGPLRPFPVAKTDRLILACEPIQGWHNRCAVGRFVA
jgi:hypothetical protein